MLWGHECSIVGRNPPHQHAIHELVIGAGETGAQVIEETVHPFHRGQSYFLPGNLPHYVSGSPTAPARFSYVCFDADYFACANRPDLQAIVDDWQRQGLYVPPLPRPLREELYGLATRLGTELNTVTPLNQAMAGALLTEILVRIHRHIDGPELARRGPHADAIDAICDSIASEPERSVRLEDAAATAGMSRTAFAAAFRRQTGMTLVAYTLATRVQRARHLLAGSTLSVADVALRSGFGNLGHFHEIFRRHCRLTPLQYRRLTEEQGVFEPPTPASP